MPPTARATSRAGRVARFAAAAAVAAIGAFLALLLGIRVVVYPQLEAHRDDLAHWLGTRIGQPVEIDSIVTGWDGWNPRLSIRGFRVHDRAGGATLLDLPRVDLLVAWTSLPRLDLRLKELSIEGPRLAVRRDTAGRLHVAGLELPSDETSDDSPFADWLLRQPQVVVRDALVSWRDELRGAPQLILDRVQFRLVQRGARHQAGLTGVPPAELAAPIDLRADLTGGSLKDPASLRGRLYVRLDYADVGAWREWLPLPFALESGRGALRVWADFAGGQANAVTADLELADVRATLGRDLAPLAVTHLAAHAQWTQGDGRTTFTATRLSLALPDGRGLAPTDVALVLRDASTREGEGGVLAFGALDLAPLAAIAAHLPLPDRIRTQVARLAPAGALRDGRLEWSGDPQAPARYAARAVVRDLAVASRDGLPGVAGLSGSVSVDERGGEAHVDATSATIVLPHVFAGPLATDRLRGVALWRHAGETTSVEWRDVAFANADVTGTTAGRWQSRPEGPGEIAMSVELTHASLAAAHRYLPVAAHPSLRDWLKRAVVAGTSGDARLVLEGDLARFPFRGGQGGRFELAVKVADATLAYAGGWPPFTDVAGDVRIDGARVAIDATRARVGDVVLGATHAEIADFHDGLLRVDGRASGATRAFLAFVAATPVAEWIGHATDGIRASGDGRLELALALPLHGLDATTVAGRYAFAGNDVELPHVPPLANAQGELRFTERDLRAPAITAQALGGPVKLAVVAESGRVRVDGSGNASIPLVRAAFDVPMLARMQGSADWKLALDVRDGNAAWTLDSPLAGASVDLPAPLGKTAAEPKPLRVQRKPAGADEDAIVVDYGGVARALLHRKGSGEARAIDRALVLVGKAVGGNADATQPGLYVRADVPALDVDAWLGLRSGASADAAGAGADALPLNGIDVRAARLTAVGRAFADVKASARRRGDQWRIALDGPELAGNATWEPASAAAPDGRIVAHLARLLTGGAEGAGESAGAGTASASRWPAVDLVAETLVRHGRPIGRMELQAEPAGADWQIRKLTLANDAGKIDATGSWRPRATPAQTSLDVAIDVKEAGAFLGHFGWPDAVKGAPTTIVGQVAWHGAPSEFDYASLAGKLALRAGAGQFTKLDPGVGRLLGVLSLQALPRRITLDFRDVFSEGFAFDTIVGNVRMDAGVMHTDDLRLVGPAAAVEIAGDVDLGRETQQLQVRVKPSLSTGVSAGAAALFLANPLLGAAVGAGTLLAQKMLNNPFDALFSYRYSISGSFDDPHVERVGVPAASPAASAER